MSVEGTRSSIAVNVSGGTAGDYFTLTFAAAPGDVLVAGGVYTNAQRAPFREAGHPGIDIYGSGRGCNTDTGLFEVKDIGTDSSGAISRLWIVYVEHCEGGRAATWGEVSIGENVPSGPIVEPRVVRWPATDIGAPNTVVPVTVRAFGAAATINAAAVTGTNAADFAVRADECSGKPLTANDSCQVWVRFAAKAAGVRSGTLRLTDASGAALDVALQGYAYGGTTSVTMTSDSGDYIGQGLSYSYTLPKGDSISMSGGRSYVGFGVNGSNGDWWYANFQPPRGDIIAAGSTYQGTRYPFNNGGAGLDISGNGRGCNTLTGSFTVNSATFAADGTIKTGSISFVQHCEGAPPAFRGTFAFRAGDDTPPAPWMVATSPVPAPPPAQAAPTIGSFTPAAGQPGTSVTVTGTNFDGVTGVTFNGATATYAVSSSTQLTATVPQNASSGAIAVTTNAGTAISSSTFQVTPPPPPPPAPTISSLSPTSGTPGTTVTIGGTNFMGATAVAFGDAQAVYNVISVTQILTSVPSGATTGAVTVTTPSGKATSSSSFTVTGATPTISSFSPSSGAPGTTVTIAGTNLGSAGTVAFNGAPAVFSVVSATQIQASVPAGATSGPLTVTTPSGTAPSSADFIVSPGAPTAPTIASFSPASGEPGTTVTITGANLINATEVAFGGMRADFSVASGSEIRATVPSNAISGTVSVTTPGGTTESSSAFTVTRPSPPPAPSTSGGGGGSGGSGSILPDLHVTVTPSAPVAPSPGGELDFVIKTTSTSIGGSSDARLTVTLPAGYSLTRTSADRGQGCTGTTTLTCDLAFLNPAASTTVWIFGTVGKTGPQSLTATATSLLEPELNPADNSVAVEVSARPTTPQSADVAGVANPTRAAVVAVPRIVGSARVGSLIRATKPTWSSPPSSVQYRWQLCTSTTCRTIPRANRLTLRVGKAKTGSFVRFVAVATIDGHVVVAVSPRTTIKH